jgi:hypothetical protein
MKSFTHSSLLFWMERGVKFDAPKFFFPVKFLGTHSIGGCVGFYVLEKGLSFAHAGI